jgi:hypothetical protein
MIFEPVSKIITKSETLCGWRNTKTLTVGEVLAKYRFIQYEMHCARKLNKRLLGHWSPNTKVTKKGHNSGKIVEKSSQSHASRSIVLTV